MRKLLGNYEHISIYQGNRGRARLSTDLWKTLGRPRFVDIFIDRDSDPPEMLIKPGTQFPVVDGLFINNKALLSIPPGKYTLERIQVDGSGIIGALCVRARITEEGEEANV